MRIIDVDQIVFCSIIFVFVKEWQIPNVIFGIFDKDGGKSFVS